MSEKQELGQYLELSYFPWPVADKGYFWDEAIETNPAQARKKLFLLESLKTSSYLPTFPLEKEPTLFLKFARLEDTPEAILSFANEHGWLGEGVGITKNREGFWGESLSLWRKEIQSLGGAMKVWELLEKPGLRPSKEVSLKKFIKWDSKDRVTYSYGSERRVLSSRDNPELFNRLRYDDVFLPARLLIQQKINEKLKEYPVRPRLLLDDKNELRQYFQPQSLLAAMWFQFFQAAAGQRRLRQCLVCKLWADVTEKNKNWTMHPECSGRERQRRFRKINLKGEEKNERINSKKRGELPGPLAHW